jgi:DNA-binding response OmpR family regulator
MKMMLVADAPQLKPFLEQSFSFQQADVIHYDNPIKAMDNVEEIQPEIVLFSATDFPRHWKPFVMYLRNAYTRHEVIFVLLISDEFPSDEAAKAEHLDVNAVLDEDLTSVQTLERIRGIITRYHQNIDVRKNIRYLPGRDDDIECGFTNPYTFRFVYGTVVDISAGGLRFRPQDPEILQELDPDTVLTMSSLRLGEEMVPIRLRIIRIYESIACEFLDVSVDTEKLITDYIQRRTERYPLSAQ